MSSHGHHSQILDCIVAGVGGVGSAALFFAAQQGWKVLGIDRFGVAHERGSSHGQTRIIRTAYFEHPNYVPLAQRAFRMWDEVQSDCRENLITRCGLIQIGDDGGDVIRGVQRSALQHGLDIETMGIEEVSRRFPMFKPLPDKIAIFEKGAGFLRVERCVANFIAKATELGATVCTDDAVDGWHVNDNQTIEVKTQSGKALSTRRLIVAAGAWSEAFLNLPLDLHVVRKQQLWFRMDPMGQKLSDGFPCFLLETDRGVFYGFPEIDDLGVKVAEHSGGRSVTDPEHVARSLDTDELERTIDFLESHFFVKRHQLVHHSVCMYTQSGDEHFLIDHCPGHRQIVFAAGLSGHGFKFAPVIGRRLVEMLDGQTDDLFEFFRLSSRTRMSN